MATTTLYLDGSGRVVIPKTVRDELHLEPGTEFELEKGDDSITLRPIRPKGHLRLKQGVWVFSVDTSQTMTREEVKGLRDELRDERSKKYLENKD